MNSLKFDGRHTAQTKNDALWYFSLKIYKNWIGSLKNRNETIHPGVFFSKFLNESVHNQVLIFLLEKFEKNLQVKIIFELWVSSY